MDGEGPPSPTAPLSGLPVGGVDRGQPQRMSTGGSTLNEAERTQERRGSRPSLPGAARQREDYERSTMSTPRRESNTPSVVARGIERIASTGTDTSRLRKFSSTTEKSISEESSADVVGMDDRLMNFEKVVSQMAENDPSQATEKYQKQKARKDAADEHHQTLKKLREWAKEKDKRASLWSGGTISTLHAALCMLFRTDRRHPPPEQDRLVSMAHHYFPPLGHIKIEVCDFGPNRADHFTANLGDVQNIMGGKPAWATVRWIHAPLGVGITHSSVEELFLKAGVARGRPFQRAGALQWPYLNFPILEVQSRKHFQEKRDVCILSKRVPGLSARLDETLFEGDKNQDLRGDIDWRCGHVNTRLNYWNLEQSDMAWQLSEGADVGMEGPHSGLKPIGSQLDEQIITRHPFYASAQIVKSPFRCFHRNDVSGVNYLDRKLSQYLQEPPECRFDNTDASALGNTWDVFSKDGTASWHRQSVEWFLVYLVTEVVATPHAISQGFNAPAPHQGYRVIVQDLKRRRFDQWKRNESVKLVQDYIACVDELTTIVSILNKNLDFLDRLKQDCERMEEEELSAPNCPKGKRTVERVIWAISVVKDNHDQLQSLLNDLESSMQALFQLRSIEQNELAIVADSQNKAILVFTGVTIVFLPLSFFTSYFGMNLKGISDTSKTESYFWAICGGIAFVLIMGTLGFAFRQNLRDLIHRERKEEDDEYV
ncbi:MAG: hypothetical protein M1833_000438 [Piccolia ochrophora]|nr:MAG: hypothetical protein M1833_000438 [Piccolia ochrophora]